MKLALDTSGLGGAAPRWAMFHGQNEDRPESFDSWTSAMRCVDCGRSACSKISVIKHFRATRRLRRQDGNPLTAMYDHQLAAPPKGT